MTIKTKCKICHDDCYLESGVEVCWECVEQQQILEMIKGRVNDVDTHRFDEKALLERVEQLIEEIEDIACECEEGVFELPE